MAGLYLAGSGSFAVEVADWAQAAGQAVLGLVELMDERRVGGARDGHEIVSASLRGGGEAAVAAGGRRRGHWDGLGARGWRAASIVHPGASVARSARLGAGCVVGPGAVVGAESVLGEHVLVSRGVLVGHHVEVGAFASLLPGCNLASHVSLGEDTVVGMGAAIVDHTSVGAGATVAAGAVVLEDVGERWRVQGVPARRYPA